jgi:hypothetical protein
VVIRHRLRAQQHHGTLEAIIGVTQLPAIVTDGDLEVFGKRGDGTTAACTRTATSTSDNAIDIARTRRPRERRRSTRRADVGGVSGLLPTLTVPAASAAAHQQGRLRPGQDAMVRIGHQRRAVRRPWLRTPATRWGWTFEGVVGVSGDWRVQGNNLHDGTYYVEGDASMSGSPGTAGTPISLSIIAEGNIDISGNPDIQPDAPELLFVTDFDLQISGGLATPIDWVP